MKLVGLSKWFVPKMLLAIKPNNCKGTKKERVQSKGLSYFLDLVLLVFIHSLFSGPLYSITSIRFRTLTVPPPSAKAYGAAMKMIGFVFFSVTLTVIVGDICPRA